MPDTYRRPPTYLIMNAEGYTVERFINTRDPNVRGGKSHLRTLLDAGILRRANSSDEALLAATERVSYPMSGASYGSGEYVLEQLAKDERNRLYVLAEGYNHGHLLLARRRMNDQDRDELRGRLFDSLDHAHPSYPHA